MKIQGQTAAKQSVPHGLSWPEEVIGAVHKLLCALGPNGLTAPLASISARGNDSPSGPGRDDPSRASASHQWAAAPWAGSGPTSGDLGGSRRALDKTCVPVCAACRGSVTVADLQQQQYWVQAEEHRRREQELNHRQGGRGTDLAAAAAPSSPPALLECECCHRVFHNRCWAAGRQKRQQEPQRRGQRGRKETGVQGAAAPAPALEVASVDKPWFHNGECKQVHSALQRLCRSGSIPCGTPPNSTAVVQDGAGAGAGAGDLAVRLYDCRRAGPAAEAGLRRVHGVLRQEFGYSLSDCRQFDYAALLTQGPSAVSAALLDVYGADLAELYCMATCTALQRRGYGGALLRQLEASLGGAGVRRLLVSVDDDDEDGQEVWRHKFGFVPLAVPELEELGRTFGAFSRTPAAGTVFLARPLLPAPRPPPTPPPASE